MFGASLLRRLNSWKEVNDEGDGKGRDQEQLSKGSVSISVSIGPPSVFGLLGFRQSPQEWMVAGDGVRGAVKLASMGVDGLHMSRHALDSFRQTLRSMEGMLRLSKELVLD